MNPSLPPGLRMVILAAGFSSRLGRPKALARVRGTSLLRRTLQVLADLGAEGVIVVVPRNAVRYRVELRGLGARLAANPRRALGLSSSVRLGIARARHSTAVLLLPVDLVKLESRELSKLISRWRALPRRVAARRIAAAGASGPRGGTPLILPRNLYRATLGIEGDAGLRDLIGALPQSRRVLMDVPSADTDIDTPQDLRAARAYRRKTR